MEELKKTEDHMQSAAAFVEGGIQEACDDACSICLEVFCESDPSTLTGCKHEFHLQCILEWCQRSSNCPMCWQAISLKDPSSQELLEVVERERSIRSTASRSSAMFHHPILGDFELQHLPMGVSGAELEERIIQHLATAAAMGRARRTARREGSRIRSSAHSRPQLMLFPTQPDDGSVSSEPPSVSIARPSVSLTDGDEQMVNHAHQAYAPAGSPDVTTNQQGIYVNNRHHGMVPNQDGAGPSDLQSSLESLKTRFNTMSMRYKETISKSTRGWREKLFSRNSDGLMPENRRDSNSGIADMASPDVADDASATEQLRHNNEEIRHSEEIRHEDLGHR